jgi:hypothetical protein
MRTRTLFHRARKAEATPTALERVAIARGQAAAKQQGSKDGEKMPDWREDHQGFLDAHPRAYDRYMERFPPGYVLLAPALRAFAVGLPRPLYRIREGVKLSRVLEAFKRKCNEGVYDPEVYELIDEGADALHNDTEVAGRA